MNFFDWIVVIVYASGLVVFSWHLKKRQSNIEDYYLGGRQIPWWAIGISTMATQLGAISFISAPAFVALKPNGGLTWLGYEFAVPVALVFVMIYIIPVIHDARVVSVYEYLERRFDSATRSLVSAIFQVSRALATGVSIYALALVLSAVLKIPIAPIIILIGLVTIVYDVWGGIKAVIYSDVIQVIVLTIGIFISGGAALYLIGGFENVIAAIAKERLQIIDLRSHGFGDGNEFSFWALLLGGFFLYVSYYGCDQSQIQREMSARSIDDAKRSLMFNGIARFILVVAYCTMGLLIGAFAFQNSEFMNLIPKDRVDYMVPIFILNYLPHGVIGFIVVAILAAFMSSLDSSINSLSAATMRDIYQRHVRPIASEEHYLLWSKILTIMWGVVCTGFGFLVGSISDTVIEAINKVGSLFYGPVLSAFILAILFKKANAGGAKLGVLIGITVNLILWLGFPRVSWLWWNATGFLSATISGYLCSLLTQSKRPETREMTFKKDNNSKLAWKYRYAFLILYFFAIIILSYFIQSVWFRI
jgi:SSS family transporter